VLGFALLVWMGTSLRPNPVPRVPLSTGDTGLSCGVAAGDGASTRKIRIDVVAGAADVFCGDRRLGRTPFDFPAQPGSEVRLILREPGRADKPIAFTVSEVTRTWSFVMNPSP
jgi:hypothetical protein